MKNMKIFACKTAEDFTKEICDSIGLEPGKISWLKFKNDNSFMRYEETVRDMDIYLVQTTEPPVNDRVVELLMAIDSAKRAGAKRITVVLPYFIYSRSDKKDQPRIPVTARLFAKLIESAGANRVITCDLHNPAIQAYFDIECIRITAKNLLQNYFGTKNLKDVVVVAPDAGSAKKAYRYSHYFNAPIALIDKRREGNDDRAISNSVVGDVKGKTAIIFDDEVESGGTLIEATNMLNKFDVKEVYVGITHGVLAPPAIERFQKSSIKEVVVTNTIPIPPEKRIDKLKILSIAPLFAETIKRCNEGTPLGDLFDL